VKVKFADFRLVTRSRSFRTAIAQHQLLRAASVELVRTLLPTEKGIRLLGVTVSNFNRMSINAEDELPLFETASSITPHADPTSGVASEATC
jgi:DNA polymerase-4